MKFDADPGLWVKERLGVMMILVVFVGEMLAVGESPGRESFFGYLKLGRPDEDVEVPHGTQVGQVIKVTDTPGAFEKKRLHTDLGESFQNPRKAFAELFPTEGVELLLRLQGMFDGKVEGCLRTVPGDEVLKEWFLVRPNCRLRRERPTLGCVLGL